MIDFEGLVLKFDSKIENCLNLEFERLSCKKVVFSVLWSYECQNGIPSIALVSK